MSISLSIFLFIYIVAMIGLFVYALLNLFHVFRHGRFDLTSAVITIIFVVGVFFIIIVSYLLVSQIDFSLSFDLFDSTPNIPTTTL